MSTASELVKKLQSMIEQHGDLEMVYLSSQNGCNEHDDVFAYYDTSYLSQVHFTVNNHDTDKVFITSTKEEGEPCFLL